MRRTVLRTLAFIAAFVIAWLAYDAWVWFGDEAARASYFKRETLLDRVILHSAIGAVAGAGAGIVFFFYRGKEFSILNAFISGFEAALLYFVAITAFSIANPWILVAILVFGSIVVSWLGSAFASRAKAAS